MLKFILLFIFCMPVYADTVLRDASGISLNVNQYYKYTTQGAYYNKPFIGVRNSYKIYEYDTPYAVDHRTQPFTTKPGRIRVPRYND